MDVFYFAKHHKKIVPLIVFTLTAPFMFHANAAYAAPSYINYPTDYDYSRHHPQTFTVSDKAQPQTVTRDAVTAVPPQHTFEGRNVGAVNGDIIATAKQFIGTPYVANSANPDVGFDCSGFVMHVFGMLGMNLPHSAVLQGEIGTRVPMSEAIPGDLLVWEGHVAIYVGEGMMIDSAKPGTTVNIRPIWGEPYVSRLT